MISVFPACSAVSPAGWEWRPLSAVSQCFHNVKPAPDITHYQSDCLDTSEHAEAILWPHVESPPACHQKECRFKNRTYNVQLVKYFYLYSSPSVRLTSWLLPEHTWNFILYSITWQNQEIIWNIRCISWKQLLSLKVYSVHLGVFADPPPPYKQSSELCLYFLQVGGAGRVDASCLSQRPPPRQPARLQRGIVGVASTRSNGTRGAQEGVDVWRRDYWEERGICGERRWGLC